METDPDEVTDFNWICHKKHAWLFDCETNDMRRVVGDAEAERLAEMTPAQDPAGPPGGPAVEEDDKPELTKDTRGRKRAAKSAGKTGGFKSDGKVKPVPEPVVEVPSVASDQEVVVPVWTIKRPVQAFIPGRSTLKTVTHTTITTQAGNKKKQLIVHHEDDAGNLCTESPFEVELGTRAGQTYVSQPIGESKIGYKMGLGVTDAECRHWVAMNRRFGDSFGNSPPVFLNQRTKEKLCYINVNVPAWCRITRVADKNKFEEQERVTIEDSVQQYVKLACYVRLRMKPISIAFDDDGEPVSYINWDAIKIVFINQPCDVPDYIPREGAEDKKKQAPRAAAAPRGASTGLAGKPEGSWTSGPAVPKPAKAAKKAVSV